jgi:hypothetical protein
MPTLHMSDAHLLTSSRGENILPPLLHRPRSWAGATSSPPTYGRTWTVLSSHGMVLCYLAANPEATQRAISDALGLTERQVGRVIKDLEAGGILAVERQGPGRRNTYVVDTRAGLRHPALVHIPVETIVSVVAPALQGKSTIKQEKLRPRRAS